MNRVHEALRALLCASLIVLIGMPLAFAQDAQTSAVNGEVLVVLGSTDGNGVAPELEKIEALKKPPFDAFTKKVLLSRVSIKLERAKAAEVDLPNGRKLQLSILEKTAEGRFRVNVSINRPGKQDYLPVMTVLAAPGDPFFVAGQKHEGGTLIIGVRIGGG